jgi:hypothetical protein
MVFDIILFGIILTLYEFIIERRENIKRYMEEIEDFKSWNETEATFRIIGNIKRLNRNGKSNIDIRDCYLRNGQLREIDLRDARVDGADLIFADLSKSNLQGVSLGEANLSGAFLIETKLQSALLYSSHFEEANLSFADLNHAICYQTNFKEAILKKANLSYAKFGRTLFKGADLRGVVLVGVDFHDSFLTGAKAWLSQRTDFENAKVTSEQLDQMVWIEEDENVEKESEHGSIAALVPGKKGIGKVLKKVRVGNKELWIGKNGTILKNTK